MENKQLRFSLEKKMHVGNNSPKPFEKEQPY